MNKKKGLQVSLWVFAGLLVVWVLFLMEVAEERRAQAELDRHEAERRWASVEYQRHKLEQAGYICRSKDAC